MISAIITISAAFLAWIGIQHQIRVQREITNEKEIQAKEILLNTLNDLFNTLRLYWSEIDRIQNKEIELADISTLKIIARTSIDKWNELENKFKYIQSKMSLQDEINADQLKLFITITVKDINFDRMAQIENDYPLKIFGDRTNLSHLHEALRRFDEEGSTIFAGFLKSNINWEPAHAHLEKYLEMRRRH